jgi:hypothetical protein
MDCRERAAHDGYGLNLVQPIPTLDQLQQPPGKASGGSAVNYVVVEHHSQVEELARLDVVIQASPVLPAPMQIRGIRVAGQVLR